VWDLAGMGWCAHMYRLLLEDQHVPPVNHQLVHDSMLSWGNQLVHRQKASHTSTHRHAPPPTCATIAIAANIVGGRVVVPRRAAGGVGGRRLTALARSVRPWGFQRAYRPFTHHSSGHDGTHTPVCATLGAFKS
jgi:hypothetical protein